MSGYGSKAAVRDVIVATLVAEGRNPADYNVTGIARDAFTGAGGRYGYRARSEADWRAAVTKHQRYEYLLQGDYQVAGWEDLSVYDRRRDALVDLAAYREAEPHFCHRIVRRTTKGVT